MGRNIALNFESRGFSVAVFNRTSSVTEELLNQNIGKNLAGAKSLEELASKLGRPRKIIIMVKADAVDDVINQIAPYLERGDIIADAGNSFFKDTIRRAKEMEEKGMGFMGIGVSGGEEGALKGPSIMVGGSRIAWENLKTFLEKIAAKAFDGTPCCAYMGNDGAGHYVKMIHNGIEYIDMQLISEAYHLMKEAGFSNEEMSAIFSDWNQGSLGSYLIEITSKILKKKDAETGNYLVDMILDEAEQKGTGKWASQNSLDLGIPVYSLNASVLSRFMSALKNERVGMSKLKETVNLDFGNREEFVRKVRDALYASKICAYAQGFSLLSAASNEYNWNLDMRNIAHIWEGGCVIRAKMLEDIKHAFEGSIQNLLADAHFLEEVKKNDSNWREVVVIGVRNKLPLPGMTSSLVYYDSYLSETLPANLIQAQRDFFGAHTYKRVDKEGVFHTEWND